ncbi:MAG: ABC transporter substrate-binding protein [Rhodobacteraceae bacterium]|nr:ABC transporter substrate-binding protein [Paracoccaceae bacterium]
MAGAVSAQTEVVLALDWKFEGPSAPYLVAADKGYFSDNGLEVDISAGQGSLDAIPKVASGAVQFGFADINSLMKFLDSNPGAPVIAVMMVYDKPPFAIIGRKSLGVEAPKDLEGRILGAPPPDGAWAQFNAFASVNDINVSEVTVEPVGFPTREPNLAEGLVDAITGYSFSSYLNLVRAGVPEDDISTILMADYGLDLYGNAIMVNTDFADENPELVTGFIRAVAAGWRDAIADPEAAVEALITRNPAADHALETRRLNLAIDANVNTDYVMENGMGGVAPDRFASAMEQIVQNFEFTNPLDATLYFTDKYLPASDDLKIN